MYLHAATDLNKELNVRRINDKLSILSTVSCQRESAFNITNAVAVRRRGVKNR
jgi:hypothetical protein